MSDPSSVGCSRKSGHDSPGARKRPVRHVGDPTPGSMSAGHNLARAVHPHWPSETPEAPTAVILVRRYYEPLIEVSRRFAEVCLLARLPCGESAEGSPFAIFGLLSLQRRRPRKGESA